MVFSGLYPIDGSDYPVLRDALDRLKLNDAALVFEPETSAALGFRIPLRLPGSAAPGDRPGTPGAGVRPRPDLHCPNVVYRVVMEDGTEITVTNPSEFPGGKVAEVYEPVVRSTILTPSEFVGTVMELCQGRRGTLLGMDYLSEERVEMRYTLPLAEIVYDFFDQLKSRTRGYASWTTEPDGEQSANLVKVDILLQGRDSRCLQRDRASRQGVRVRGDDDCQTSLVDPAAAVRGADPGRHRLPGDRPRDDPRDPQRRAGQVLRRRHQP